LTDGEVIIEVLPAGAVVGIDNIASLSCFQYGSGRELYDQL